jgi:sugar lactone lactonase YvrE
VGGSSLAVPARIVTSVCFAGRDRCDLIVTTGDHTEQSDLRGCVLRTRVDVRVRRCIPRGSRTTQEKVMKKSVM